MELYSILVTVLLNTAVFVKSDCESDLLKCLGGFITDLFNKNSSNSNASDVIIINKDAISFDISHQLYSNKELLDNISASVKSKLEPTQIFLNLETEFEQNSNKTSNISGKVFKVDKKSNITESKTTKDTKDLHDITKVTVDQGIRPQPFTRKENIEKTSNDPIFNDNHTVKKNELNKTATNQTTLSTETTSTPEIESSTIPTEQESTTVSLKMNTNTIKSLNDLLSLPKLKFPELNEIHDNDSFDSFYDGIDDTTDYPDIDYVEIYKDVTVEDLGYTPADINVAEEMLPKNNKHDYATHSSCRGSSDDVTEVISPWIAAIFVRNGSSGQFDYVCDGAVLAARTIVTGARCVTKENITIAPQDVLVILGKKSLQMRGENEAVYRAKDFKIHVNFSNIEQVTRNDLAMIHTETDVDLNKDVQFACLSQEDVTTEAVDYLTTGWAVSGEITPIYFEKTGGCVDPASELICSKYEAGETCPSHGGLYFSRSGDKWYLRGIRSSDPTKRGLCYERDVTYTDLRKFRDFLNE